MLKKVSHLLHREWNSTYESAILMGAFAIFSQLLILSRDRLLASHFGAGQVLDIYFAASRIPDLLFVCTASGMTALVFLPVLVKHASESDARAQKFINDTFTVVFMSFVLVAALAFAVAPIAARYIFPSFTAEAQHQFIVVTRMLLLAPLFFSLSNLLGSMTQVLNRFVVFAGAAVFYILGIALGAILFYPAFGIVGIAMGAVAGAFLNFFIHFFIASRNGFIPTISWRPSFLDIWELVRAAFPRAIYLVVSQILLLILVAFAAKLEPGSIAVFSFSFSLQSLGLIVVGMPFTTSAFPGVSKHSAREDLVKFADHIVVTTRRIIFWSLPGAILILVLRAQIVRTLLGTGAFGWTATKLTAAMLAIFAFSITAQSLSYLLVRGFHMIGNKVIPLIANILSATTIGLGTYGLMAIYSRSVLFRDSLGILMRVDDVSGSRVLLLAVAYSTGVLLNLFVLHYFYKKCFPGEFVPSLRKTFSESIFASLIGGFVAYEFLIVLSLYLNLHTTRGILFQGLGAGVAGVAAWWLVLELIRNEDIQEFRQALGGKFSKAGIILPGQEEI